MSSLGRTGWVSLVVVAMLVLWSTNVEILAQKASTPKSQEKVALGEEEVKRLLLLMDTDKDGKISKTEFMAYMEAEFKRLDKNNDGKLDAKELTKSKLRAAPASSAENK
jgi:Ca2+-binding EF-hand superfamily protein